MSAGRVGFRAQLGLLLWKNFLLKRRSPVVVLLELFIPLLLFLVLLGIRHQQPAVKRPISHYDAWSLPSTGFVGVAEAFCDGGEPDAQGFRRFHNSSTLEFLSALDSASRQSSFHDPRLRPANIGHIPAMYKRLLRDPLAVHDYFHSVQNVTVGSLLRDEPASVAFLERNYSLSHSEATAAMNLRIDPFKLTSILFWSWNNQSHNSSRSALRQCVFPASKASDDLESKSLASESLSGDKRRDLAECALGAEESGAFPAVAVAALLHKVLARPALGDTTAEVAADAVISEVLDSAVVQSSACAGNLSDIFANSSMSLEERDSLNKRICNLSSTEMEALTHELASQIDPAKVVQAYRLDQMDWRRLSNETRTFLIYLEKFSLFRSAMSSLAKVASHLPQDECRELDWEETVSLNATTGLPVFSNDTYNDDEEYREGYGMLKIWNSMQRVICGSSAVEISPSQLPQHGGSQSSHSSTSKEKPTKMPNFGELGLSSAQSRSLEVLFRLFSSNPKFLYAPANTSADAIVAKANETFAWVAEVGDFALQLENVSRDLRDFLALNSTKEELRQLAEFHAELRASGLSAQVEAYGGLPAHWLQEEEGLEAGPEMDAQLETTFAAACSWRRLTRGLSLDLFKGFDSEAALVEYFLHQAYWDNVTVFASVVFAMGPNGSLPSHMVYKIRQNASYTTTTQAVRSLFWYPSPRTWDYAYYTLGFMWVQDMMERAMVSVYAGRDVLEPGAYIQQMPYPCYVWNNFLFMIEHVLPMCLAVSWIYSSAMLVQAIVQEKESRLSSVMRTMGLRPGVHWVAWFLSSYSQMSLTMLLLTAILKAGRVLAHSNPLLILLILQIFAAATICFSFLVSTLYSKSRLAAACAGIIYFFSYVPFLYISIREESAHVTIPAWAKGVASLSSTTAFGLGAKYLAYYEMEGVGSQWHNVAFSPLEGDSFSLAHVMAMMSLDILLYSVLVWYIERVRPGDHGLPLPWYFPLQPSYWFHLPPQKRKEGEGKSRWWERCLVSDEGAPLSSIDISELTDMSGSQAIVCEPDPVGLELGIEMERLTKIYNSRLVAVSNLSLNLYKGQITAFLGHNGAGKTTTMSMLAGFFPPSSGTARIGGRDIRSEMGTIRRSLGTCPQHNVLFERLSVMEHLRFYAQLKGTPPAQRQAETEAMLWDTGLADKRHAQVHTLSGGMKRKLSVGIAFLGGSSVVILDEPTAGVDPAARRGIWDLLLKYKRSRTIMLSTHHMDEAEVVGDRIAVVAAGQLRAVGSPLFLKARLGDGYKLTLVKSLLLPSETDSAISSGASSAGRSGRAGFVSDCDAYRIENDLSRFGPSVRLREETLHELHFNLQHWSGIQLSKLFAHLEDDDVRKRYSIASFGLRDSTFEEIFLKVCGKSTAPTKRQNSKGSGRWGLGRLSSRKKRQTPRLASVFLEDSFESGHGSLGSASVDDSSTAEAAAEAAAEEEAEEEARKYAAQETHPRLVGSALLAQQFRAMLSKRWQYTHRNWKTLASQMLLPVFFVAVAMSVALTVVLIDQRPSLELSPAQYYNFTRPLGNVIPYWSTQPSTTPADQNDTAFVPAKDLVDTLVYSPAGVAATCLLKNPNITFDPSLARNSSEGDRDFEAFERFFIPGCSRVFAKGLRVQSFLPPTVTAGNESDWNMTSAVPWSSEQMYPACRCKSDGTGFTCREFGFERPPRHRLLSSDLLLDISGQNESLYYLHTTDEYRLRRYGGLSFGHILDQVPVGFGQETHRILRKVAVRRVAKGWYNHKGYHSMPIVLNTLNNAILRAAMPLLDPQSGAPQNPAAFGFTLLNHPMEGTNIRLSQEKILQGTDVLIALFIVVAMSFVPAAFVLFLVTEKRSGAKHLQTLAGLSPLVQWTSSLLWDLLNYASAAWLCLGILRAFNIPAYVAASNFSALAALFLLYGWAVTPLMYVASFWFEEPSTAYIVMIVLNLFVGITTVMTSFILQLFSFNTGTAVAAHFAEIHQTLKMVFLIFPSFCLGRGLMDVAFNHYFNEFFAQSGQWDKIRNPFHWDIVNRNLAALAIAGALGFLLTLLLEIRAQKRRGRRGSGSWSVEALLPLRGGDGEVAKERRRVLEGTADRDIVRLLNLSKAYSGGRGASSLLAVDRMCLGIPAGECFGLLGVNGAGKTTTFRLLSGQDSATGGEAWIGGHSLLSDRTAAQRKLGYCPQFDALYDELTAREHLELLGRVQGIAPPDLARVVDSALRRLDLVAYADSLAGTFSGGTKRKLSTAQALIGDPDVVLLDEPTTSMDPQSRRFLWDLIRDLVKGGKSVVLTSHSMEECEALCTRLAILVNGRFQCLGSGQQLKNRYGDGYSLFFRLNAEAEPSSVEAVSSFLSGRVGEVALKESHQTRLHYGIPSSVRLSTVFALAEEALALPESPLQSYSVTQNNLDSVFIGFARHQGETVGPGERGGAADSGSSPLDDSCLPSQETEMRVLGDSQEDLGGEENEWRIRFAPRDE